MLTHCLVAPGTIASGATTATMTAARGKATAEEAAARRSARGIELSTWLCSAQHVLVDIAAGLEATMLVAAALSLQSCVARMTMQLASSVCVCCSKRTHHSNLTLPAVEPACSYCNAPGPSLRPIAPYMHVQQSNTNTV